VFTPPVENDRVYDESLNEYRVWLLARMVGSSGKQPVPAFGGFVSATGMKPTRKSTIDYFTPINQPFTEYCVIQELLRQSEEATAEVGQKYILNTFDLGGCMKALPLIWKFPEKYKLHVVTPGQFHTVMNYMGMLTGHKFKGSGYAEILLEADLVTSGCLKSVLSGKAYAKALYCLKTVCEALERLMMEKFEQEESVQVNNPVALFNLVKLCNRENTNLVLQDPSTLSIISNYVKFEEKVRTGLLGKTASFWFGFIDYARLILMLIYSVKTNNLKLFHKCNGEMANLFFAFDGPNYSRYLVWLEAFLTNIDLSHPGAKELLENGGIAVARSLIPGALSAVDKTMEETFMKFAKSDRGLVGLFSMFGAYQCWCRITSTRAQYFERMLEMCGLIQDPECPKAGKHRELEAAEIKKSENAVQRTLEAIKNFTNPFDINDKDHLYNIASGAPVSPDVEIDVLQADTVGKTAKEAFIRNRFQNGSSEKTFFEPIKRQKLKTMEVSNKTVKLTSSQGKLIQYSEQSNLAFMLLVKSQLLDEPLSLDELMHYSLTPVPPSLGTPDGFFAKTNKASMLHFLLDEITEDVSYPDDAIHIQDGMALWYMLTNIPQTCGGICLQVLDCMVAKKNFMFSTDCYHEDSIKAQERVRRGSSHKYIIDGPATRKPADFKLFLANEDNKRQLCQLLFRVWGSKVAASRLQKCGTAVIVKEGKAYQLKSSNGEVMTNEIPELSSDQEETDTRIILYLHYAAKLGYKSAVVRTPDSDIFFIMLHHSHSISLTIFLDIGMGKHRQIINVTELAESLEPEYCTTLLGFYVFSGEDCTSAFKGKGKVGPLKKLQKNPKYHKAFRQLGDDWTVKSEVMTDVEAFTCLMYGQGRETSVDVVRAKMLRKMVGENENLTTKSKVDLTRLPPCRNSLVPHVGRVNYRLAIYKRANQACFWRPKPYDNDQRWVKTEEGFAEPVWSCGPILPPSLIDLIKKVEEENDDDDEEIDEHLVSEDDDDYAD